MLYSASYKANLFSKNCSKNYNLESSGISLPGFASTTNQKLKSHNKPWIIQDLWSWLHYHGPVSLLSVVSKVFEKLVNNRFVEHLAKCGLFSDFQYCFRSIWSTADLLTVASDRIAWTFNMSGATQAVALDISKAVDRGLACWCFLQT